MSKLSATPLALITYHLILSSITPATHTANFAAWPRVPTRPDNSASRAFSCRVPSMASDRAYYICKLCTWRCNAMHSIVSLANWNIITPECGGVVHAPLTHSRREWWLLYGAGRVVWRQKNKLTAPAWERETRNILLMQWVQKGQAASFFN